ncbi:MAG: glycosyltransferase [Solirubrobacterales bacterium]
MVDLTRPDYSIVVPAYNEEALLPATLERLGAVMAALPFRGEVVVCDNNSTDRTGEIARAAGALVVFEPVNQISRARNTGARAAQGLFLVFVDADTHITSGLLDEALRRLASGGACGGGATVVMDGAPSALEEYFIARWNGFSRRMRLAAGSFIFVLREAFDEVGGFSEKVYASEEIWLSRDVKRWGRKRGLEFVIIEGHPVHTSGRKGVWYPPAVLFVVMLGLVLFPFLLRSRAFCWLWYRRPAA